MFNDYHLINAMENKNSFNIEPVSNMLRLIEKIILVRNLDRQHHRDEFEKHFSYLLQGKDMIDVHERRAAGITDQDWEKTTQEFKACLKLK